MNAAQLWDESAQNSQTPPRTPPSDRAAAKAAAKTGTGSTQTNPSPAAAQIVPVNAGVQLSDSEKNARVAALREDIAAIRKLKEELPPK